MNDIINNALNNCLTMMDQGSDLESCLVQYPEYAADLRFLLLAAMDAESIADNYVPIEAQKQGKAKFLNAAAEIREQRLSKKMFGFLPLRKMVRFSFAALVVAIFVMGIGGTGLVSASDSSLPGDKLYPLKLTWENIQLNLVSAHSERDVLTDKFDQERVQEINALINSKRLEKVKFYGRIEGIFPSQIIVSRIPITILPSTKIDGEIQMNAFARIEGQTQPDGTVLADKIMIVSIKSEDGSNASGDDTNSNSGGNDANQGGGNSDINKSRESQSPELEQTKTPKPENVDSTASVELTPLKDNSTPETKRFEIEGLVNSYNGSSIEVSGKSISINPETELKGSPSTGSRVFIRGYINQNGELIALHIKLISTSSSEGGGGQSGDGGSDDANHNDPSRTPEPSKTQDD